MEHESLVRTLYAVVSLSLLLSVVTDLYKREIKDVVTYPTLLICLAIRAFWGGWGTLTGDGVLSGLVGTLIGGVVFFIFYRRGAVGFGDVKLVAAIGAGVGFPAILFCFIGIGMFGGVHALILLIWRGEFFFTLKKIWMRFTGKPSPLARRKSPTIPYAPAIALGCFWGIMWQTHEAAQMMAFPSLML